MPGLAVALTLGLGLVVSSAANGWPAGARQPIATLAVAAAALVVGRALIVRGERRSILAAFTLLGAFVAVTGMIGLAVHSYPLAMRAQGIWRTSSTLTYANAAGGFLALTLFASIAFARDRAGPASRIAAALILAGLVTSLSRAAILGAMIGAGAALLSGGRAMFRGLARPALAGAVLTAALIPSIASDRGHPWIALAGLAVALAVAASPRVGPARARSVVAVVVLAAGGIALSGQYAGRLFDARLGPGSEDRARTWGAAWNVALERPVLGTGPGTFAVMEADGDRAVLTRYVHNEYLQAFAETGVVGVGSIAVTLAIVAIWIRRRRPSGGDERRVWALALGACVAFAAHSAFDFVWHVPVLVALAFLWLSLCVVRPEGEIQDGGANDET